MKLENLVSLEVKLYGRIIASTRKDAPKLFIADSNGALAKTDIPEFEEIMQNNHINLQRLTM